jgi:hypothetical protein
VLPSVQAFLEQLQRVAVWATRARGDTATIGHQLRAVTTAHIAVAATRRDQSARMASELVAPLAKRIKSDTKHMPKMEDEFRQMSRSLKSDLRKAETAAYKAQKQVMKKGDSHQPALSAAVEVRSRICPPYSVVSHQCSEIEMPWYFGVDCPQPTPTARPLYSSHTYAARYQVSVLSFLT